MRNFLVSSSHPLHATLLVFAVAAAASALGCAKETERDETAQAWSCVRDDVPMGETVRCTSSALTSDGPAVAPDPAPTATTDPVGGETSDGTTYECGPETSSADCPPPTAGDPGGGTTDGTSGGGTGGTSDGTTDGTSGGGTGGPSDGTTDGTTGGGTGGTSGGGTDGTSGGGTDGTSGGGTGTTTDGTADGSGNPTEGPNECAFVPDLEYCPVGDGGSGGSETPSPEGECTDARGKCGAPGQAKKGTKDGTTPPGHASGPGADAGDASSPKGKGKHWQCKKDKKGNKSCVSTPECAVGTHPAPCGACVADSEDSSDCVSPKEGGCWVTGGGYIAADSLVPAAIADGNDNFGGNAKTMKDGKVSGHWNHVDHGTGNHAKGRPEYIMCRTVEGAGPGQPGGKKGLTANQVYFGGHAQWRNASTDVWSDGYWFDVVAEDHGEPGNTRAAKPGASADKYHFTIRRIDDPTAGASGTVIYETRSELVGGNIQLHPANNGHPAANSPLPSWVTLEP